jgi:hypothetical protein
MKLKKLGIAAALAALALGASSSASAYVYAGVGLSIQDFTLAITGSPVTITRFDFALTNVATLNGASQTFTAACGGTPGLPGTGANDCSPTPGSMDALAANAPLSTLIRTNNSETLGEFTLYGALPANLTGNWANSDSVIESAELVNLGQPTETHNVAESLLTSGTSAASSSEIQSTTGFTIRFQVLDGAGLTLNFLADPDLRAAIFGELPGSYSAQANLTTSFTLSQAGGDEVTVNWNPQGTAGNNCQADGGSVACTETADSRDLNRNVGVTTNNREDNFSWDPNVLTATAFGISVTGLGAGDYTLSLNETKSTRIARTVVPEPGMVALMGIALMGFVASARRRKNTA